MTTYHFKKLLQNSGWLTNVRVTVDNKGIITEITTSDSQDGAFDKEHSIAIPGFQNAHSHAFQYAMAGLAERHEGSANPDDFWGWREAMYQLALSMNPDEMEAIATMLYSEMARHGYTNVAEFHYVHHDKDGKPYTNLAEMGSRLIAAAKTAGIGITLCPIFYQKGGFGQPPNDRQKRFISPTIDAYLKLLESSREACKNYEHANIAIGIHSMRGVEPKDIAEIAKSGPQDIPFHIHVSEQLKEIEDSIAYLGKRPVEWMLENVTMNERYHLVHATHLTKQETIGLAQSGANVVICPSTEGNLGDGLFPLRKYQEEGGKWSIGTDSHVGLNPLEELRILDYGQRLISHKRNTYFSPQQGDGGTYAIEMATVAGRKAMNNFESDYFKVGEPFNACIIDGTHPLLANCSDKNLASTIVYATDSTMQEGTISHGKRMMENGKHIGQNEIRNAFHKTMRVLGSR
ncbi:formimidoylglutamate deiminase [Aureisphaera galaxeae]|uniref:formimidoylglutamate deiminase n=1 Tax=Aureisphaera galaxeae TaxID=1538023 RepID=UPI00235078DC|nr:formimidoylglutamate deiminase [Aureisphaera galaxeae]MDC8003890.1 formimidoylglutamate deiminase [Aureisphaera galaxeae]